MLERLKNDIETRHIPVCVISTDDAKQRALSSGAAAFLIDYKVPVVLLSLAANGIGIALMVRTLRHARRMAAPACH